MTDSVSLLTFTSLYPSASRPRHGIFVESRLQKLLLRGGITANVVAPVPWFPFAGDRWGEYGRFAATPRQDVLAGVQVRYPRYPVLPRIGMHLQPSSMARAGWRAVSSLLREGMKIDVIDAHYLYPDGVAAAAIAQRIGKPFVLSARGTDVNVIAQLPGPRVSIVSAIAASAGVIAVSSALKAALIRLGVEGDKITVLRNGVDSNLFYPEDRASARAELGLPADGPVVASVGNLFPGKRHDLVLECAAAISGLHVIVVGRGPERDRLRRLVQELDISRRVSFFDEMPQSRLRLVYSAANALVLASEREGWPNVLLESAACGTPVIAFDIGGVPEIVADRTVGVIVPGKHAVEPLANAIRALLAAPPARESVRQAALRFSWDPVLDAQLALYRQVARKGAGGVAVTRYHIDEIGASREVDPVVADDAR